MILQTPDSGHGTDQSRIVVEQCANARQTVHIERGPEPLIVNGVNIHQAKRKTASEASIAFRMSAVRVAPINVPRFPHFAPSTLPRVRENRVVAEFGARFYRFSVS